MNKPVAWMNGNEICPEIGYETRITTEHPKDLGWIPLSTHPVKEKGLPRSSPSPINQACLTRSDDYTPIAWSCWSEGMETAIITTTEPDMYGWQSIIPLFTHPVKELTDEEIESVYYRYFNYEDANMIEFAKAILRKAQEK